MNPHEQRVGGSSGELMFAGASRRARSLRLDQRNSGSGDLPQVRWVCTRTRAHGEGVWNAGQDRREGFHIGTGPELTSLLGTLEPECEPCIDVCRPPALVERGSESIVLENFEWKRRFASRLP